MTSSVCGRERVLWISLSAVLIALVVLSIRSTMKVKLESAEARRWFALEQEAGDVVPPPL